MGTLSEVFDAEQPFTPRGCIAQAWTRRGGAAGVGQDGLRPGLGSPPVLLLRRRTKPDQGQPGRGYLSSPVIHRGG